MQEKRQIPILKDRRELIWLLLIIFLAALVRLIKLGAMPFNAVDASLAADALAIARNQTLGQSALPAYTGLTSALFYVLGSSNFIARLLPVLAGVSLVVLSFLLAKQKSLRVAIIFSLALALDPLMVNWSRQIATPMIALAGLAWAVYLFDKKRYIIAGFCLAVVFLGGYSFWVLSILALALWAFARAIKFEVTCSSNGLPEKSAFLKTFISFLISVVLLSTGFFLEPAGFGQIGASLMAFLGLFEKAYQFPVYHSFFVLIRFALLPFLGAIIWLISRGNFSRKEKWMIAFYCLVSVLFGLFFSRTEVGLSILILIPLWYLTARYLSEFRLDINERISLKIACFVLFLVMFIYIAINLPRLIEAEFGSPQLIYAGLATLAGVLLVLIVFWLGSLSLGMKQSSAILAMALVLVLISSSLALSFNSLDKNSDTSQVMVNAEPILLANEAELTAINPFQDYGKLNFVEASFLVEDIAYDLRWFTREFQAESSLRAPEFVITHTENPPNYDEPYRGMPIELSRNIPWTQLNFAGYFNAIIAPERAIQVENANLWALTKLFTGAIQ